MPTALDPQLLYVYVADWEYGCCEDMPHVGQQVQWSLEAIPAEPDDLHRVQDVTWVEELGIVRFRGGSAGLSLHPRVQRGPLSLIATWHSMDASVTVIGTAATVTAADDGLLVGIRVRRVLEPTPAQADELRLRRDRDARTIGLTGPAVVFGPEVPAVGDRLAIDMADRRVRQTPGTRPRTGVVVGVVRQVNASEHTPSGGRVFSEIDANGPAPAELFVMLVCDR